MRRTVLAAVLALCLPAQAQQRPAAPAAPRPQSIGEVLRCAVTPEDAGPASVEMREGRVRAIMMRPGPGAASMVFDFYAIPGATNASIDFELSRQNALDPAEGRFQLAQRREDGSILILSWFIREREASPRLQSMTLQCPPPAR